MTWFKVDDGFADHPKVVALLAGSHSEAALALWVTCGAWCAKHLTDGFVPVASVKRSGFKGADKAAAELIRVGLWEAAEGGFQFKGWHEYQPLRSRVEADRAANADKVRRHRAKSEDSRLVALARCGEKCHHCGAALSVSSMTLDHLIPRLDGGSTSAENLVAACVSCNSRKGKRKLVTGYKCRCVTGYEKVADGAGNPAPVPTRPDPSHPDGDPLTSFGDSSGVRVREADPSAAEVQTRFRKLFADRFGDEPYLGGGDAVRTFPGRLIGTARARGVDALELLAEAFERWAAQPRDEIAQNAPYAAFSGRFGSLIEARHGSGLGEREQLQADQAAALKGGDRERYRSLVAEERRRFGGGDANAAR